MAYKDLTKQLSLREQANMLTGADWWHTAPVNRLGIPSIMVSDGPTGLRKEVSFGKSITAVCYPSATAMASSWDKDLMTKVGETLGEECLANRLAVLLGPGINIKRSPLCGRNFEYYSEDPVLAGELAASYINGVQSKGVGTSLKHYAANSTEVRRMVADSIVDERALREIYLKGFEIAVKKAQPWTIMAAYNKVNGNYCTQSKYLLNDVLRDDWGFEGLVVSDWTATHDRVAALKAGMDLEMPSTGAYNTAKITAAYRAGELKDEIETSAGRVLGLVDKALPAMKAAAPTFSMLDHHDLAADVAAQCAVLLKNDNKVLPLKKDAKIAVIGERAENPIVQGCGSAQINSFSVVSPMQAFKNAGLNVTYAQGYDIKLPDTDNTVLTKEAVAAAEAADVALVFVTSAPVDVAEGTDRKTMKLPSSMNNLVEAVAAANKNTVVVLTTGSAVEIPWADKPAAILQTYLAGEGYGTALTKVLFGEVNPSGKLPETYPKAYEDTACPDLYKPDENRNLIYKDSIFVGYRYYDTAKVDVLYPFGYGLSYTTFDYSDLKVTREAGAKEYTVTLNVTNTGDVAGAEVVQMYLGRASQSLVYRPAKELKGFTKVYLEPGETKEVTFTFGREELQYWSIKLDKWVVEGGAYDVMIGASSADIRLSEEVAVKSKDSLADEYDWYEIAPHYFKADIARVSDEEFYDVLGYDLTEYLPDKSDDRIGWDSTLEDAKNTSKTGKLINTAINAMEKLPLSEEMVELVKESVLGYPIGRFAPVSSGILSDTMIEGLIHLLNSDEVGESLKIMARGVPATVKNVVMPKISAKIHNGKEI